jgi:hypothetical protein
MQSWGLGPPDLWSDELRVAPDLAHGEPPPDGEGGVGLTWRQPKARRDQIPGGPVPQGPALHTNTEMPPAQVGVSWSRFIRSSF